MHVRVLPAGDIERLDKSEFVDQGFLFEVDGADHPLVSAGRRVPES